MKASTACALKCIDTNSLATTIFSPQGPGSGDLAAQVVHDRAGGATRMIEGGDEGGPAMPWTSQGLPLSGNIRETSLEKLRCELQLY